MSYAPYSVYKIERLLRRRRRRLLFALVGLLVMVGVVVGGSYLWLYAKWQNTQIDDPGLEAALDAHPALNLFPAPEGTMNILVLGIDNRGWEMIRSDTMILVHADPGHNYLSTLSLPRDLRVDVPGYGTQKLNFAYAKGGAELAIKTAETLTGVDITHYLEVDFNAFKALTEAVGGVYVDVDKHYLQENPDYEMCDILPGYQKLDGENGLDYVRFRKDNNSDFGRQQRQQRYLSALREQAMRWDLGLKLPSVVTAMTDNIKTTISFEEMRDLAYWAVTGLGGGQIRQVVVIGDITDFEEDGQNVSYVVTDRQVLGQMLEDFVTAPTASAGTTPTSTASTAEEGTATTEGTVTTAAAPSLAVDSSQFVTNPLSIPDASEWNQIAADTPFKVMAPGYVPQDFIYFDRNPGTGPGYDIDKGSGTAKGLKVVYQLQSQGEPQPEYLGIMETTWLDAPAAAPGERFEYNGTTYTIVGGRDQVERIWWRQDGVLYWVSNTIMSYLSADELIKVAASMMTIDNGEAQ